MLSIFRHGWGVRLAVLVSLASNVHAQNDAASRRAAIDGMYPVMLGALEAKNFGRARNICEQAILWEPQNPAHHYNLACIEAQAGGTRIPYAWGALELAIALGFNDVNHLQTDPDLAPLRREPRFTDLVRNVAFGISAGNAVGATTLRTDHAKHSIPSNAAGEIEEPARAEFKDEVPVGLYLMSRYATATLQHELSVWYFAPDRKVYRGLENGFSAADLASHPGLRGSITRKGSLLEIAWSDGQRTTSAVEREGSGFTWDLGIYVPVQAFETAGDAAGVYEGSATLTVGQDGIPVAQRIELRADGTFAWQGASLRRTKSGTQKISLGSKESSTGKWQIRGFSLVLTQIDGAVLRRFAFPDDDEKTVIRPDRMFFGGLMYKRRP
jgi:hypothetical protein